jgi:hypothetical protein
LDWQGRVSDSLEKILKNSLARAVFFFGMFYLEAESTGLEWMERMEFDKA